jgi:serine protease Do
MSVVSHRHKQDMVPFACACSLNGRLARYAGEPSDQGVSPRHLRIAIGLLYSLLLTTSVADAQGVADLFKRVAPTVVVVRSQGRDAQENRIARTGSGVLISADGQILTAAHLVASAEDISVEFVGGQVLPAHVQALERPADLSLIQLQAPVPRLRPAKLANSDTVRVGDQIIVVGAPYGLGHSLTVGWISARWPPSTVYKAIPLAEFFQTDASINTGNSGGPMFNMAGEVVGVVSHTISRTGGSEGVGFVVTANTARQQLLQPQSIWSGLEGRLLSETLADVLNLPPKTVGFLVQGVAKDSPAGRLGIRGGNRQATIDGQSLVVGGDIILAVNRIPVSTAQDLAQIREMTSRLGNEPIIVRVMRSGREHELQGTMARD